MNNIHLWIYKNIQVHVLDISDTKRTITLLVQHNECDAPTVSEIDPVGPKYSLEAKCTPDSPRGIGLSFIFENSGKGFLIVT